MSTLEWQPSSFETYRQQEAASRLQLDDTQISEYRHEIRPGMLKHV